MWARPIMEFQPTLIRKHARTSQSHNPASRYWRRFKFPVFIKDIYPVFWRKSIEMVECISAAASDLTKTNTADHPAPSDHDTSSQHDPRAIEVGDWSSRATLDIIGLCGMGQDFNSLLDPSNKLNRTYKAVTNPGRSDRILQIMSLFIPCK